MLSVSQLSVQYGATQVIKDVTFDLPKGETTALLGGNGAGKTSLLNALSGLVVPAGGSIKLDGVAIGGRSPDAIVRLGLVQVPQGRFVWPSMPVADNLRLGAVTLAGKNAWVPEFERVLELFPILKVKLKSAAGGMSGGEQQMLAIARALMAKPRILLMDEPSAGLSPLMVQIMIDAIKKLCQAGLTIMLVEQNIGVAEELAQTAIVLANGEIAFTTPASDMTSNKAILSSYFGH